MTTATIQLPDGSLIHKRADGYPESVLRHLEQAWAENALTADEFVELGNRLAGEDSIIDRSPTDVYRPLGADETWADYHYIISGGGQIMSRLCLEGSLL